MLANVLDYDSCLESSLFKGSNFSNTATPQVP